MRSVSVNRTQQRAWNCPMGDKSVILSRKEENRAYEAVVAAVCNQLRRNVDGLEECRIEPARSMMELGASSLDIIEIVSATMRELAIRVPRAELVGLRNIDGLVHKLVAVAKKKNDPRVLPEACQLAGQSHR